jgi:hypothetical protein
MANHIKAGTKTRLFKPKAPNDMKTGDLSAKWWIITDREPLLTPKVQRCVNWKNVPYLKAAPFQNLRKSAHYE